MRERPSLTFDRGTIVVRGVTTREAEGQGGLVWDARVGAHRAPAARLGAVRAWLESVGAEVDDQVTCIAPPRTGPWRTPELRPYQAEALEAWSAAGRRGVVVLPTGAGKTRVAIAAMAAQAVPSLVLVPTRVLLHQWREEIAGFTDAPIGCLGDGQRLRAEVTVSTYESALRTLPVLGASYELLVVDEVHHFGVGARDEVLEMATAPMRLGLTAAPPTGEALERVGALVGPIVLERLISDLSGRWLAPFEIVPVHLALSPQERRAHDLDMAQFRATRHAFGVGSWSDFVRWANASDEGRAAIAAFRRARRLLALTDEKRRVVGVLLGRHRRSRTLVFTEDNASAYALAREHLVMPITCDIGRAEREDVLARFRSGELSALISARVLNEGLDVPDADVAIVVGGALGQREHVQRVGRLLRPVPGKRAVVYDLVAAGTSEQYRARDRREALGHVRPSAW